MKKEIFDSLARLSPESDVSNRIPQMTPSLEISGELALCLDTLMNTVGQQMNLSPRSVFEKILTTGIESWVKELPDQTKKSIGLGDSTSENDTNDSSEWDDDDPDAARAQQAAYAQLTESYGYTPLTAHAMTKSGNGRGDQRNGSNGSRKNSKQKKTRNTGKKQATRKQNSRKRRFSPNKAFAQPQ